MYEVKGLPSMVMSTRRLASSGTTWTPFAGGAAKATEMLARVVARAVSATNLGKDFASRHDLLRLVVEGNFQAGLDGGDVHAEGDGVAVTGFNGGVGSFAGANTFHPVAHVGGGLRVAVGIGISGDGLHFFDKREAIEQVWFHAHFGGRAGTESAGRSYGLLVHVDHAA